MTRPTDPATELQALIDDRTCSAARICSFLDGLRPEQRVAASRSLGRARQRSLWQRVDGFGELTLSYFVPEGTPALTPVRHEGRNTLPVFSYFAKVMYRYRDGVAGYNDNPKLIVPLTGPGYFVCVEDPARKEVRVDYTKLPSEAPAGWPKITPNTNLPMLFIFGHMVDTMRRVSEHVSIGSAARHGKDIHSWFTLCRQEVA